ncbi:MAG: DUF1614 domain-containing protein [Solirubrobacteraceae bacterium]
MSRTPYNRHPLGPVLLLGLGLASGILITLFLLGAVEYAYRRIGIPEGALFALVLGSLVGGIVNIPIARLRGETVYGVAEVVVFGVRYRLPVVRRPMPTILAVNVGGAVIPTVVSALLLIKDGVWWPAAAAVTVVAVIVHLVARPVQGLGIAVPGLAPPLLAAGVSLLVAPRMAAPVAYISGALGTLIGADLLNLHRVRLLGAGIASIGGAGTFDGIFLSSIMAVLLVAIA